VLLCNNLAIRIIICASAAGLVARIHQIILSPELADAILQVGQHLRIRSDETI
jgi:hypothetical protein